MRHLILITLILCCSINQGKTQTSLQKDLEWVAKTIQKNNIRTVLGYDMKERPTICTTDYDSTNFLLNVYYYYEYDNKKYVEKILIDFKKITSAYSELDVENNVTDINFGNWKRGVNGEYLNEIYIKSFYGNGSNYPQCTIKISNDGEDFIWKKMNTKLNNIFKAAKGIK